ncbi:MAG: hypothetical protein M1827_001007 [Pycnora praestabilis]|nr:MAG: hypothetical protein M1827_001007 [Pycnora praestabilis]
MEVRTATIHDLDIMLEIGLKALYYDLTWWDYRYPLHRKYPEETRNRVRLIYKNFLENTSGEYLVQIVEAGSIEDPNIKHPMAWAAWDVAWLNGHERKTPGDLTAPPVGGPPSSPNRDENPQHVALFRSVLADAKKRSVDSVYGTKQLCLAFIVTDPGYFRRGAGKLLCQWGIDRVTERGDGWVVALIATRMGRNLYENLGFRKVADMLVQVEGEEESIEAAAMVYEPAGNVTQLE